MCLGESSAQFAPYFLASGAIFLIITLMLFFLPAVKKWKPGYLLTSRVISIALTVILFFYAWSIGYFIPRFSGCV